jgi:hypothetical protein
VAGEGRSCCRASRQTQVELDVLVERVLLEPLSPRVEGEAGLLVVQLRDTSPGRALGGVVELSEDHVEGRGRDSIGETRIRDHALRSRGDEKAGPESLQLPDEVTVVGRDVSRLGNGPNIRLQVQIKSINKSVAEGTRSVLRGPLRGDRTECSNEELGEVFGDILRREVVARGYSTTEREQNLLAPPLAGIDTLSDGRARRQKLAILRRIGGVLVPDAVACVS